VPGGSEQYIAQVDSRHILGTTNWVGRRLPHHCTAVGKVLVAFGAARLQRGALERLTPHTITDRDALSAELDTVRACGYATAVGELEPGLVAVAAPVLDADGRAVAAISISGPQFRIPSDRLDGFGKLLTKETETLSARLGFRPAGEGAA
jgi:DNA-binding IclR family transcriptional regulator